MNTLTAPVWVPPLVRVALALLLMFIGVSGWADGYGMAVTAIGSSLLVAELVGAGLTAAQAAQLATYIQSLESQLAARSSANAPVPVTP